MEFSEWISNKFVEWRGNRIGRGSSIADFAAEFGASQPAMSRWMHLGSKPPRSAKYINALYDRYGNEILEVLGIDLPSTVDVPYDQLPPPLRASFSAALAELNAAYAAEGVSSDSPRALEIALSVLSKHGFSITNVSEISGDD
jgi:transcriptional regulator with XRE-family HTH domain